MSISTMGAFAHRGRFAFTNSRNSVIATALFAAAFFSVATPAFAAELIVNPSFEIGSDNNATNWTPNSFGTNDASTTIVGGAHSGSRAAQVAITTYTDGDVKWVHDPVTVAPNDYSTISFWYKSTVATSLYFRYSNSDVAGAATGFHWMATLPASAGWTQYTTNFFAPAGVTALQVIASLEGVGMLTTDDYSLEISAAPLFSQGIVSITFDDGWQSIYNNAIPMLNAAGLKSTQYVYTDFVNTGSDAMTSAMLQTMFAAGHEIGDHTKTHDDLVAPPTSLSVEIHDSRITLANLASTTVGNIKTFAYPYGAYNATVKTALQTEGYSAARSVDDGYNFTTALTDPAQKYALKIKHVTNLTTVGDITGWINQAVSDRTWLILMLHETVTTYPGDCLSDEGGPDLSECSDKAVLQGAINHLVTTHTCVQTVAQVLAGTSCVVVTPVIAAHADVIAQATSTTGAYVTYTSPAVTNGTVSTATCTPASGTLFAIGSTTVTCSAPGATNTTFTVNVTGLPATVQLLNLTHTFDGTPKSASAATTPPGLIVTITYNGSATAPTAIGSYAVVATINSGQGYSGVASGNLIINDVAHHMITASADVNGSISPSGGVSIVDGGNQTFTMTPNDGFHLQDVNVDGNSLGDIASYDFTNVTSDHTIAASFSQNGKTGGSHKSSGGGGSYVKLPGIVLGASTYGAPVDGLTEAQVQAILDLLKSFGADQSVIDAVNASLHGVAVLGASTGTSGFVFTQTLQLGSTGNEVTELQKRLTQKGFYAGPITGYFGPMTKAGVQAYQTAHGILAAGIVGPLTRAALNAGN